MPQKPEDLSRLITKMAERVAKGSGLFIDGHALSLIGFIPLEYSSLETIDVDLSKLEEMIEDIILLAGRHTATNITRPIMERALAEVRCHYLWFC